MIQTTTHRSTGCKPKLVYFQFKYDERLPRFLLMHKDEHVRCLQQNFDVVVITDDCDYDAVCAAHKPDMTFFESGVPHPLCRRPKIANTHTHPHVPKAGLLHADAFCQAREGFISDMYEWGIDTFFAIATAAPDFNHELQGRLFIWPNSIDPAVYRDYGEQKNIDVLFTGSTTTLYPWRRKLLAIVPKKYASTIKAHAGYSPSAQASRAAVGETYARLINSAFFVPSCGTVAHEVVRKHFEIPACNSCLITERTAVIETAGYQDMVNCVFADERDVIDKLQSLFADPEKLAAITRAGHLLVHARHTMKQRDQVHQWFVLNRALTAQQRIVQADAFAPMAVVDRALAKFPPPSPRPQLDLLAQGDEKFRQREYVTARRFYKLSSSFVDYMPEPLLRVALCELHLGSAAQARSSLELPLEFSLGSYRAAAPDPVEWAWYVTCLLCLGRRQEAARNARLFGEVEHLSLRRVRWLLDFIDHGACAAGPIPENVRDADRVTIHCLPVLCAQQWQEQMVAMLGANGRGEWARALGAFGTDAGVQAPAPRDSEALRDAPAGTRTAVAAAGVDSAQRLAVQNHFARRSRRRAAKRTAIKKVRGWLYELESRLGYFLPFRYSSIRHAEFFLQLQEAFNDSSVSKAIAIAPHGETKYAQGFLHSAAASTKDAVLRSLSSWNADVGAQGNFDLALVDCSVSVRQEELTRAIARFADTSQYLFFVNCRRNSFDGLVALLGEQFERTAMAAERSAQCEHLVFRRIQVDRRQEAIRQPTPEFMQ